MSVQPQTLPTPGHAPGWFVGQLPVGMRDDNMLVRFATIFERLGSGLRQAADGVEHVADPTVTTPDMLAYLGGWLGYDLLDPKLGLHRQREIIRQLGAALPLRGTRMGLTMILRAITAGDVHIDEAGGVLRDNDTQQPARGVTVTVASTGHLREHELRKLVRDEVPAHLPVNVVVDPALAGERS